MGQNSRTFDRNRGPYIIIVLIWGLCNVILYFLYQTRHVGLSWMRYSLKFIIIGAEIDPKFIFEVCTVVVYIIHAHDVLRRINYAGGMNDKQCL